MSNWMKNTQKWLGLSTDPYFEDEYEESGYDDEYGDPGYDESVDRPAERPAERPAVRAVNPVGPPTRSGGPAGRSSAPTGRSGDEWGEEGDGGVRVINAPSTGSDEPRGVVRPLPTSTKPFVVSPSGFNDVQQVADKFKRDQPVIMNMQGLDRDLSRRLIDFASGLCYGLEGTMERVTDHVFLLTPHGAQVSDDDRRRISEGDLADRDR